MSKPYTPFPYEEAPFLGELPLKVKEEVEYALTDIPSLPAGKKINEVLVYIYITVKSATRTKTRAVYQIYSENTGLEYSQLMNTAFPEDDFVMNSANLWLPTFGKKKEDIKFKIRIPDGWCTNDTPISEPNSKKYKNLHDAMKDYVKGTDSIYTGVFLLGYR